MRSYTTIATNANHSIISQMLPDERCHQDILNLLIAILILVLLLVVLWLSNVFAGIFSNKEDVKFGRNLASSELEEVHQFILNL
jgi:hypothetical protein